MLESHFVQGGEQNLFTSAEYQAARRAARQAIRDEYRGAHVQGGMIRRLPIECLLAIACWWRGEDAGPSPYSLF